MIDSYRETEDAEPDEMDEEGDSEEAGTHPVMMIMSKGKKYPKG